MSSSYGRILSSRMGTFKEDKDDKEGRDGNRLRKAFDLCDTDKSGYIDKQEFKDAMRAFGFFDLSDEEVSKTFKLIDTDKDGFIDYTEFVAVMTAKINVKDIFNCFEPTDNKITVDDIKRVAKDYDKSFSDTELHQMLIYADTNGDGFIDEKEFEKLLYDLKVL